MNGQNSRLSVEDGLTGKTSELIYVRNNQEVLKLYFEC